MRFYANSDLRKLRRKEQNRIINTIIFQTKHIIYRESGKPKPETTTAESMDFRFHLIETQIEQKIDS